MVPRDLGSRAEFMVTLFSKGGCLFLAAAMSVSPKAMAWALTGAIHTKPVGHKQAVRLKAELIEVRVIVTDWQGQPVGDLKKEDFELLENGRPREIAFFSVERMESRSERAIEPGRDRIRPAEIPARVIVLFVDTLHLSFSSLARARQALRTFIEEQVSERDFVALVATGGAFGLVGECASHRRVLLYAIERLTPWEQGIYTSGYTPYLAAMVDRGDRDALRLASRIVAAEEGIADPAYVRSKARMILNEAAWRRKATLSLLEAVAKQVAEMPGQRIIVLISDGFTLMDIGGRLATDELNRAIGRAVRSGVTIYSLQGRGLEPNHRYGQEELENGLNALARDTGGRAFFNTNDLNAALQQVLEDTRTYYVLGYYSDEDTDTRFRRITVRVKGRPEYRVRAPKGYLPVAAKKEPTARSPRQRLFQAIAAPLPVTSLGVAVSAEFLESEADDAQVSLFVHLDGTTLTDIVRNGRSLFEVEVVAVIYDHRGKPVTTMAHDVSVFIRPGHVEPAKHNIYHFAQRVALPPGLYHVRVGVREPSTDRMGTAMAWVEVPDLRRKQLTVSGLFLAEWEPEKGLQLPDIMGHTIRRVRRGTDLVYYLMIYNASAPPEELKMRVEIFRGEDRIHESGWMPVSLRMIGRNKKGIEVAERIVWNEAPPGFYELRVTVSAPGSKQMAQRAVVFEVGR
jgi:VWFA-related protein